MILDNHKMLVHTVEAAKPLVEPSYMMTNI
uniref:Uncharacterized protein n=1 Tax=Medicago truncatula TaxID=3880 RepID=I3SQD2_MEDTR|nr:unknown [Medicago truncatula]